MTPTRDELQELADKGYTIPRVAAHYDKGTRFIRQLIRLWPDIEEKIRANGKIKTQAKILFGNYKIGSI